ncbi:hypothetical protein LEP1GSC040_0396 [Leptospira santarosai str. 2000030832]|nr:hypothetical protein LEP1GSC040_0396 [Leptospira santarosai str. 2000030832]
MAVSGIFSLEKKILPEFCFQLDTSRILYFPFFFFGQIRDHKPTSAIGTNTGKRNETNIFVFISFIEH